MATVDIPNVVVRLPADLARKVGRDTITAMVLDRHQRRGAIYGMVEIVDYPNAFGTFYQAIFEKSTKGLHWKIEPPHPVWGYQKPIGSQERSSKVRYEKR